MDDELWAVIEPLQPATPADTRPAQHNRRLVFQGILFVLFIEWEDLPQELEFGSGMTCWRRLRDWQAAGVLLQTSPADLWKRVPSSWNCPRPTSTTT
ncbi:transposase [Nocardia sp. NPDC058176]|uniref:transposase n=1 Tax=Nocardia sp. NPDC058176 TaxID=3346368 RepID=UPI0036DC704B